MKPSSAYNKRHLSKKNSRVIAWKPIIIESINTISNSSKGTILDIEKDVIQDSKMNLESKNLFNTLSLPLDYQIITLNYSHNYISKIEKIQHLKYLQYLDFSDNHLLEISGLPFSIKALLFRRNRISRISGLDFLVNLNVLDLSCNNIQEISGLDKLQNLTVLNLESNKIENLTDIGYLSSLVELNLSKNQIKSVSPLSLKYLKRLVMGHNLLDDLQTIYNFVDCTQLLELYLDGNPFTSDSKYKSFVLVRLSIKFLDGKRITEEERRTCSKLEKRASEKRIEAERLVQRENEKKSILENIQQSWNQSKTQVFSYPSKSKRALKPFGSSQVFDGGFYQISNGCLEIFGNALCVLENIDPSGITFISFNMIHIKDVTRFYPVLARYRYLTKLSFNRTMIEYLIQFNIFKSFDIHEVSISELDNPITGLKITKNYLIYTFKNLLMFQGQSVTESEKNKAWMQFGPQRRIISQISPRLLTKNQTTYLPYSHVPLKKNGFSGFNSDNESVDSDVDDHITPVYETLSASSLISAALKQKKIKQEFEIRWKEMIQDVIINH